MAIYTVYILVFVICVEYQEAKKKPKTINDALFKLFEVDPVTSTRIFNADA